MKRYFAILAWTIVLLCPAALHAGFTETLPQGTFLIDESFAMSSLDSRYDDHGKKVPLIDEIERYEPGAGLQGVLTPEAKVRFGVLINQIQYGILDNLSVGAAVPVVMYTEVKPNLKWKHGDYQWYLGHTYSEDDFWEWAASMGQPKPKDWSGNHGVLSDIILATRYRFTDGIDAFRRADLALAAYAFGALPTGRPADPEEVVSVGTTTWDLHSNGELGLHLSVDKFFKKELDGRLTLGLDAFYEALLRHEYKTPAGEKNPLLLNYRPYVGRTYTVDPGDFIGGSFQADVVPYKGPVLSTWLTKGNAELAAALPPTLALSFRYTFLGLEQSDWQSDSAAWDYQREKLWKPGYKNILWGQAVVSLLRFGVPVMPYASYRNQTWIPGKNSRAADVFTVGTRIVLKFW
jgi:hypothetical protein